MVLLSQPRSSHPLQSREPFLTFPICVVNDSDHSDYDMSCEKKVVLKQKSPRWSFRFQLICLTKGPINHWTQIAINHLLKFHIQHIYLFACFYLGRLAFRGCFVDTESMSQSVVATVLLETRLTLWNFSLLHVSPEKPTIYFQKQALKGVPIYTVLSKIFKSLKNYKFEQISWSKFLEKITVNETSKSYYCPRNIEFFHTSFSKIGYHLERPDIKNISEWLLF